MHRLAALVAVFILAVGLTWSYAQGQPMPRYEDFPIPMGIYGRTVCKDRAVLILVADDETTQDARYFRFYGWYWKDDSPKQDNAFLVIVVAGEPLGENPDDRIYFDFQRDGEADAVFDWAKYEAEYPDDNMCDILAKVQ